MFESEILNQNINMAKYFKVLVFVFLVINFGMHMLCQLLIYRI